MNPTSLHAKNPSDEDKRRTNLEALAGGVFFIALFMFFPEFIGMLKF